VKRDRYHLTIYLIWAALGVAALASAFEGRWSTAFVAVGTIVLSYLPFSALERFQLRLPPSFLLAIVLFTVMSLFLGEAFDFYERLWWWDIFLHAFSALGFGILGFLFIFMLFEGDRYAAPPWAMAFFGYCFAVTMGATWEIFEFTMDQLFGLNMQKSGLPDTMGDLIVDALGALVGAIAGFLYLKGRQLGGLEALFDQFIEANRRFFRKYRRKDEGEGG